LFVEDKLTWLSHHFQVVQLVKKTESYFLTSHRVKLLVDKNKLFQYNYSVRNGNMSQSAAASDCGSVE